MSWFDNLSIDCICGDIFLTDSDAIACNTNINLGLNYSLGNQLLQICGPDLLKKLREAIRSLPGNQLELGQAIAVEISCPLVSVDYVIFFCWWTEENEFTSKLIYQCLANILRSSFALDLRSISVPLFGAGSGSMDFQVFQTAVSNCLLEFNALKISDSFSLEEILFYSTNHQLINQLNQYLNRFQHY